MYLSVEVFNSYALIDVFDCRYEATDLDSTDKIYGNKTQQMLEEKLGDNQYSRKLIYLCICVQ